MLKLLRPAIVLFGFGMFMIPVQIPGILRPTGQISTGKFLIASEFFMKDPLFRESVLLIVQYSKKGTVGLILNHPTHASIHEIFPEIPEPWHMGNPVYIGGPVAPHQYFLLVRTNQHHENSLQVIDDVAFSAEKNAIKDWLDHEHQKDRVRLFAGCAGWSPEQLESEIKIGGWLLSEADAKTVFETNSTDLWKTLTGRATQQQAQLGRNDHFLQ